MECKVESVERRVSSVECKVWNVKCKGWSVECGVWSVECRVWSVERGVWSAECGAPRLPRKMTIENSKMSGLKRIAYATRKQFSTRDQTGWSVTNCGACHAKCHDNLLFKPSNRRGFAALHRHGEATRKPETRDETRGSIKTKILCETSSNFHTL